MREDRAVSEVVGFILVFSLIVMTVGVVYVAGFGGLESARDAERLDNMERAFDVLGDNVEDIDREGAPSRATELKLADGRIGLGQETNVTVSVGGVERANESTRPIVFASGDARIAYENGAVVRSQGDSAWMSREPTVGFQERGGVTSMVFTVVDVNRRGSTGVAGDTTVLVRTIRHEGAKSIQSETGPGGEVNVTVETTAVRADAWQRYLDEATPDSWAVSTVEGEPGRAYVVATGDVDRWVVRTVHMDAAFA